MADWKAQHSGILTEENYGENGRREMSITHRRTSRVPSRNLVLVVFFLHRQLRFSWRAWNPIHLTTMTMTSQQPIIDGNAATGHTHKVISQVPHVFSR
jgi:hypothetical protein